MNEAQKEIYALSELLMQSENLEASVIILNKFVEAYAHVQVIKELEKVETFKHWGRLTDYILSRIKELNKQNR